jgi:outer membrane protein OmpA-like peptidoglycan-associated protein
MGEARPRTAFGLLAAYEQGPVLLLSNLGLQTRSALDTKFDFQLGNEAVVNLAGVLWLPTEQADRVAVQAEILTRVGIRFSGAAESSMEWTAGFQYRINESLLLDAGLGRGITSGYGTSNYRVLAGLRYQIRPEPTPEERGFVVEVLDIPEDEPDEEPPPDQDPEPPPSGGWREGELARQVEDRIEIRDPIQFEYGTAKILPESLPTLRQVTALVNRDARIGHLLIEGHASEEGTFAYNYDLSTRRAKAVFEQLFALGVHPERMSYRGLGEVVPLSDKADPASLAANRRVEFEVVRQIQPGEPSPPLRPGLRYPWSGEPANPTIPPPVPVEAPPPKPASDLLAPAQPGAGTPTPSPNPPGSPAGSQESPR